MVVFGGRGNVGASADEGGLSGPERSFCIGVLVTSTTVDPSYIFKKLKEIKLKRVDHVLQKKRVCLLSD